MAYSASSKDLMSSLISKMYHIITGEDADIKFPNSKYITWIMPGIPFIPEDFNFCIKGFAGSTAEETRLLTLQAFVLSKLFDFIPDPSGLAMDHKVQQSIFATTQDTISSVYRDVLQFSKVVNREISEEEQKKMDEKRAFITSKETEHLKYYEKYRTAAQEYLKARSEAESASGDDPISKERVTNWINMGHILKENVDMAEREFRSLGFRDQIADAENYIAQVTENSMVNYKARLEEKLTQPHNSPEFGPFLPVTLIPGNFASSSSGWTQFSFSEQDFHQYNNKSTTKGSLGGSVRLLGVWKVGKADGSTSTEETDESKKASNFTAQFEIAQIPILRPWFEPGFFSMRGWDLGDMWNLNWPDKKVSNGEDPPVGRLVAYPTSAIFVRNVTFSFDESSDFSHYFNDIRSGSGLAGWGVFRTKGTFSSTNEQKTVDHKEEHGKIVINGMQLIGFINNVIPKAPNLNPNIKPEELVGGAPRPVDPLVPVG